MSSTGSQSEPQTASPAEPTTTPGLVLPPTLAGSKAAGPAASGLAQAHASLADLRRFHLASSGSTLQDQTLLPASLFMAAQEDKHAQNILLLLGPDPEAMGACGTFLLWPTLMQRLQQAGAADNGVDRSVSQQLVDELRRHVVQSQQPHVGPEPALQVFSDAGRQWLAEHSGDTDLRPTLLQEIEGIVTSWGPDARILLPDEQAYLHLFVHAAAHVYHARRSLLRKQIEELAELLRAFLAVEASKDQESRSSQGLQQTMGQVGSAFLNTSELSKSLGTHRGATQLPYEQRQRAEEIVESLQRALHETDAPYAVIVHDGGLDGETFGVTATGAMTCEVVSHDDPCRGAGELFEVRARESASLFRDMHIAHLLLENRYEPARHDPWFERFDWHGFTQDEFFHLPTVVAMDTAERLSAAHLSSLSELLLSDKPVQVLVSQSPWQNPTNPDEELMGHARMELGYLGMGHRKALVQQASLLQPQHLVDGYRQALESPHPALHVVAREEASQTGRQQLMWEAATLSRAHPLFCFNPDAGSTWARRMDFSANPQAALDWPTHSLDVECDADSIQPWHLPCTFADFVLLESKLQHQFMPVADDCRSEDLLRLDEYLQLPLEEAPHRLPWIWACDSSGVLQRLLVSRRLVQACRDRLDYWQTLQELAGVRNQYVEDAVEQTRQEDQLAHAKQVERLTGEHTAAMQSLERETVKKSMRRLSRMLLDLDPLSALTESTGAVERPLTDQTTAASDEVAVEPPTVVQQPAAEPAAADAAEDDIEEVWIESMLCTTCNDCMGINPQVFVYNENKQAIIDDPHAGTFEQLVLAAEKCPADCIHPGKPLNPQEANLASLIERAAPYN